MRSLDELTMYVHDLLDAHEERGLRAHVDGCPECRATVAKLQAERDLMEQALARDIVEAPVAKPDSGR